MEHDLADAFAMVPQCLVGLHARVQVEPAQPAVVTADQHIVPLGMDGHGGDCVTRRLERLLQLLFRQVVNAYAPLRAHKEKRLQWMKNGLLDERQFLKRRLRSQPGQLMQDDMAAVLANYSCKIVALAMPSDTGDLL